MTIVYEILEQQIEGRFELDPTVGISNLPNFRLTEARRTRHPLNILVIGGAGMGKGTLINSLFCAEVMPQNRPRAPPNMEVCAFQSFEADLREGSAQVHLSVTEVLGFGEARGEAFQRLKSQVIGFLKHPLVQKVRREYAGLPNPATDDKQIHAVIYMVSGNCFEGLSGKDREMIEALQQLAYVVPVVAKADMFTRPELLDRKAKIRKALGQAMGRLSPSRLDPHYKAVFEGIEERWPLAVVASKDLAAGKEGPVRVRNYPWGILDIDDDQYNDLGLLQHILIRSLFTKIKMFAQETIYESFRRAHLPALMAQQSQEAVREEELGSAASRLKQSISSSKIELLENNFQSMLLKKKGSKSNESMSLDPLHPITAQQ